jgi:hypothetical protein
MMVFLSPRVDEGSYLGSDLQFDGAECGVNVLKSFTERLRGCRCVGTALAIRGILKLNFYGPKLLIAEAYCGN